MQTGYAALLSENVMGMQIGLECYTKINPNSIIDRKGLVEIISTSMRDFSCDRYRYTRMPGLYVHTAPSCLSPNRDQCFDSGPPFSH